MDEKVGQPATADHTQRKLKRNVIAWMPSSRFIIITWLTLSTMRTLRKEQEILDGHNDEIAGLASRINTLNAACSSIDFRI